MRKKLLGGVLIVLLSACGGAASPEAEHGEVPAQYQGAVQSTDTARGEQLFTDVCGACHEGGAAPDIRAEVHAAALIRMIVREGEGTMPPLDTSRLSEDDLEAILAYMVSIHAAE